MGHLVVTPSHSQSTTKTCRLWSGKTNPHELPLIYTLTCAPLTKVTSLGIAQLVLVLRPSDSEETKMYIGSYEKWGLKCFRLPVEDSIVAFSGLPDSCISAISDQAFRDQYSLDILNKLVAITLGVAILK